MADIDFVITWVDGADPRWIKEKSRYSNETGGDSRDSRFRDWDVLRFWFRGIELYAPWVRKIHFVTWGHTPEWLNTDNPKINVVRHKDFIPEKYLPTFSSHPIEWNIFRIPDLSEKFVLFNDDMFLLSYTPESFWFKNDIPCDMAVIGPYITSFRNSIVGIVGNNMEVINTRFNLKEVISEHPTNWFNLKYGKYNLFNIVGSLMWPKFTGFRGSHFPNAYLKSTFELLWEEEVDLLEKTCMHRFRDRSDVNHWLVRYWQLATNHFIPRRQTGYGFLFTADSKEKIHNEICNPRKRILCLNDIDEKFDFEEQKAFIQSAFLEKFPEKSAFEK